MESNMEEKMMNKIVKAGIIGFGYMGNFHLNRIREIEGIEAVAVYDIDPDKKEDAKGENLKVYDRLEDLLENDEIELVVICTPNDVHAELAIASLNAKKHVLCEKPAVLSIDQLDKVLACAKQNQRIFTTHQNRRWDNDFKVVQKIVQSNKIGQITTIFSQTFGQRGVCYGWRADADKGGGMLYDWGIHLIDQMLILFEGKKVKSVYARLRSILTPVVDDYFEIELEFEDDIVAHISVGTFALQERTRWFLMGDKGTAKLNDFSGTKGGISKIKDNIRGFSRIVPNKTIGPSRTMAHLEKENIEDISLPIVQDTPYEFYNNLIAAINGNELACVTDEEMRRDMQILESVFESNRLGQKINTNI